ncbi:MAG: histidine--tRNA ligase, partial [Limnochordia bacterium]
MNIQRPRGTNDILPEETGKWQFVEAKIRELCRRYGYQEIRTPVFEHTELFVRGIGEATDIVEKEMYAFTDRSGRSLALRPEGTAGVVRAFVEHRLDARSLPVKLYYLGPMFRYEKPQAGRYRQFAQFGVEAIGSIDPFLDVEMIMLPIELYRACGLDGFQVQVNSIGCPKCRVQYREALLKHLGANVDQFCPNCRRRIERNPLRVLDCKEEKCRALVGQVPLITDYLCLECADHFQQVK